MKQVTEIAKIPRLGRDAHKGDRGRVLLVAGSLAMSGAARLAGWGALRGGAGLLTIATPEPAQPLVAAELACAMTLALPARKGVFIATGAVVARRKAESVDAVGIGPGITTGVKPFLRRFLDGLDKPVVLDADALNMLATEPELIDTVDAPTVLTPHPGEAARLLGHDRLMGDRVRAAAEIADRYGTVAVLKGAGTVVCDGDRYYVNRTGNPGMATGGTGDVLTGLIAARLAAGADPFMAAVQAVFVHGTAGDLAAASAGERGMIATDLVANLASALDGIVQSAPEGKRRGGSRR